MGRPRARWLLGLCRRRSSAPSAGADVHRLRHLVAFLVRVVSELAERVPRHRGDGVARRLPTTTMVAGIQTGARTACRNGTLDRKSTRLNSSHSQISYAVFC